MITPNFRRCGKKDTLAREIGFHLKVELVDVTAAFPAPRACSKLFQRSQLRKVDSTERRWRVRIYELTIIEINQAHFLAFTCTSPRQFQ